MHMNPNEKLFRILIEEGFGKGDVTLFDRYTSQDFVEHQYGFNPPYLESVKKAIESLHRTFPDFSMIIEDLVIKNDIVWGRMTARGTQRGNFMFLPPTGRKMEITVIDIMRFRDSKLIEHWGVPDRFAVMEQLGLKPPPKIVMKMMSFIR